MDSHTAFHFISSRIQLSRNAYKSILFRCSSIVLQFAIYRIFCFLAFNQRSFTSYIMFGETPLQKALYILSRKFNRHSFLVIGFAVMFGASGLWDSMLWGLDAPGWVLQPKRVTAELVSSRPDPAYVVHTIGHSGDVGALDLRRDMGEGLWDGVNATLTGTVELGVPRISSVTTYNAQKLRNGPGARIWLDDSGFSVSVDYMQGASRSFVCPEEHQGINIVTWNCQYDQYTDERNATDFMENRFAIPSVWWEVGGPFDYVKINAERGVNPWQILSTGGDTVIMKEVFTVTKGTTRHTFLLSAFKVTLLSFKDTPIDISDVQDLVERTWPEGRDSSESTEIIEAVSTAIRQSNDLTMGKQSANEYTVINRIYQVMKPIIGNKELYTIFQILDSNVTILRTETLPAAPQPFETCDTWYRNEATGGKVRGTDCDLSEFSERQSRFLGQTDTSTVFVLQETLGKRRADTAATALNETAWRWFQANNNDINSLVLSRGYILGVNSAAVMVEIGHYVPAVSILQLILVAVPFVAALMAYALVRLVTTWHYQASLLSNLVATTHPGYDSNKPKTMKNPPELGLEGRDGLVYMKTHNGVFWQTTSEAPGGLGHTMKETTLYEAGRWPPQSPWNSVQGLAPEAGEESWTKSSCFGGQPTR